MDKIFNIQKYKTFLILTFILCIFSPINVKAIKTIYPGDAAGSIKEKCDNYYKCVAEEIGKANSNGIKLTSSNVQISCMNVRVVTSDGASIDYCDENSLLNGKNLVTLLTESNVKDDNDAYQNKIKQCEEDKKSLIVGACSECKKCMDKHEGVAEGNACSSQCYVSNPNSCGNSQEAAQKKIPVISNHCQYTYTGGSNSGNNEGDNYFKPIDSSQFKCGGIISDRLLNEFVKIYKTVGMIMVVAVIIFGMLDFFKAVSAGDADTMKKVTKRFTNRLIIAILIATLPIVLELILSLFGNESMKACLDQFK